MNSKVKSIDRNDDGLLLIMMAMIICIVHRNYEMYFASSRCFMAVKNSLNL